MLARPRLWLFAAIALACGVLLAPRPAEARVHVFVGGFFGFPGYYYPPAYYYPPYYYSYPYYPYYSAPPPAYYSEPPAYGSPPPPPPRSGPPPASPAAAAAGGRNCQHFHATEQVDGVSKRVTHTVCQQPDGSWKIVR